MKPGWFERKAQAAYAAALQQYEADVAAWRERENERDERERDERAWAH